MRFSSEIWPASPQNTVCAISRKTARRLRVRGVQQPALECLGVKGVRALEGPRRGDVDLAGQGVELPQEPAELFEICGLEGKILPFLVVGHPPLDVQDVVALDVLRIRLDA
jgi:hypothetical protein